MFGRSTGADAPLSGGTEFREPDFTLAGAEGESLIGAASHVRLTHPTRNQGTKLLRRGYTCVDGKDDLGRLEKGLFFTSFQRSPDPFTTVHHGSPRFTSASPSTMRSTSTFATSGLPCSRYRLVPTQGATWARRSASNRARAPVSPCRERRRDCRLPRRHSSRWPR
ncbi:Dyp-type peroxidase domain-containing protein [Cryobacterium sp. Y11]|uniref:Dyp-type peroxidase domain-containing protein n=1 Tax=Cryobacterium sp. Y11 TaxID=2045016 RepID=UPI001E659483|nr:Dyp-type peroxidase domain-containing protein [Cryobacterium sp. Y11]